MFFSTIELRRDVDMDHLTQIVGGNEYRDHQILWKLFQGLEKREFLFRREDHQGWPCFYVVSSQKPEGDGCIWVIRSKTYRPKIRSGQILEFSLRVNPVKSKLVNKDGGRGVRHDVVMEAKKNLERQKITKEKWPTETELIFKAGFEWLNKRAALHGFEVNEKTLRIDGYRQHRLFKKGKEHPIRFSTLDFQGLLTVKDSAIFVHALCQGIGPAKGFGCGLMMVKHP